MWVRSPILGIISFSQPNISAPALQGIEQSIYDAFREVEKVSDFKIIEMNAEDGNHIYLALKMSPRYSVSLMVNRIKGITTHLVWGREPQHISRFHWKGKKALCHIEP